MNVKITSDIKSNVQKNNNHSQLKKFTLVSLLILIIMSLKKFFTIATIGAVTLGLAVGIGISKNISITGNEAAHVDRPGSDYTKVWDNSDGGKKAYYVDLNTELWVRYRSKVLQISTAGWVNWYTVKTEFFVSSPEGKFAKKYWFAPFTIT